MAPTSEDKGAKIGRRSTMMKNLTGIDHVVIDADDLDFVICQFISNGYVNCYSNRYSTYQQELFLYQGLISCKEVFVRPGHHRFVFAAFSLKRPTSRSNAFWSLPLSNSSSSVSKSRESWPYLVFTVAYRNNRMLGSALSFR